MALLLYLILSLSADILRQNVSLYALYALITPANIDNLPSANVDNSSARRM